MIKSFTVWIEDDVDLVDISGKLTIKRDNIEQKHTFNISKNDINDTNEYYFAMDGRILPVHNGEC